MMEICPDEIWVAIKQLKNGRAAGVNTITTELLKLGGGGDSGKVVDPAGCQHIAWRECSTQLDEAAYHPTA